MPEKYFVALGSAGARGYISQTVPTTPGTAYSLSCWFEPSPDGLAPNEFVASWNGNMLMDQINMEPTGWTNRQFTVTATGTSSVIKFGGRDDLSFLGLRGITLLPVKFCYACGHAWGQ